MVTSDKQDTTIIMDHHYKSEKTSLPSVLWVHGEEISYQRNLYWKWLSH